MNVVGLVPGSDIDRRRRGSGESPVSGHGYPRSAWSPRVAWRRIGRSSLNRGDFKGLAVIMLPDVFTTDVERELGRKVQELENELTDARKQHAAAAEVIRVIAGAPADVQPVFDAIVTNAARLCDAAFSAVAMFEG